MMSLFTVRYCRPAEYATRVLVEVALLASCPLAFRWLPWLSWSRHLPEGARVAGAVFLCAMAAADIAELRIRRQS